MEVNVKKVRFFSARNFCNFQPFNKSKNDFYTLYAHNTIHTYVIMSYIHTSKLLVTTAPLSNKNMACKRHVCIFFNCQRLDHKLLHLKKNLYFTHHQNRTVTTAILSIKLRMQYLKIFEKQLL